MTSQHSKNPRFFIIDGYALLYRAHFAMIRNPLITSYGLHTSALFGFVNQILKLIRKERPDYLAAVFDAPDKTFRHEKYPEYKATREKMPEELRSQLSHLWPIVKAMNIPNLVVPGFEADDIIGTLVKWGEKKDIDVFIVSGDKDFMQLINDNVFLYAPGIRGNNTKIYDPQAVIDKWGLPPEKIIDLLGLMGDASDNVPGVRGVGEKSAVKLLNEYGTLENALDHAEDVKNKRVRQGLLDCREEAILSKELVTIVTDMELSVTWESLKISEFNYDDLRDKFFELEFTGFDSQLAELSFVPEPEEPKVRKDSKYTIVDSLKDLDKLLQKMEGSELLSIDLETTSIYPMLAEIVGISISMESGTGYYIPVQYKDKKGFDFSSGSRPDLEVILKELKGVLENEKIGKTGQNLKYDLLILQRNGINVRGTCFDTIIAAHLINPGAHNYSIDNLAMEYLKFKKIPTSDLIGRGKNQITMAEVELEKIADYACEDADVALQLTEIFKSKLEENELTKFYNEIELPLIPVLMEMEKTGCFVDEHILKSMSMDLGKKLHILVGDIIKEAGTEFNLNSTQQLATILFDQIGLPTVKKRSTAVEVLERLKDQHPLPGMILDYRKYYKLKNTYLDPFPTYIHSETKRIHTSFNQTVAATGRLSSSNPNFQNIPIRTDFGREIRKAFRPQKSGWKIISADYSQVELRIMAHLSADPGLLKAFKNGEDIHTHTASLIYGVSEKDVLPEMRRTAKIVNFGIMYGAGPFRMSQELGIPRHEAIALIDSYFNKYSNIKDYIDSTLTFARDNNYVQTLLGRKRWVWDVNAKNKLNRDAAERIAINMPIQGTAAELIKIAMVNIHHRLKKESLESKMILQIHDELLLEAPDSELETVKKLVIEEMECAMKLDVPLVVDCGSGKSWFEAH